MKSIPVAAVKVRLPYFSTRPTEALTALVNVVASLNNKNVPGYGENIREPKLFLKIHHVNDKEEVIGDIFLKNKKRLYESLITEGLLTHF